jgi:hypothetical protein
LTHAFAVSYFFNVTLAGAFAGAFAGDCADLAAGAFGFGGAPFCSVLAWDDLEGEAFGCGALGWGAFACEGLLDPFFPFFEGPSFGGGPRFALAAFLRSNSAFWACSNCFLFHCSSFNCFSVICHTTGLRRTLARRA